MDNIRFYDNELDAAYVRQIFLKESSYVHLKFDDDFKDSAGSNHGSQTGGVTFKSGMENRAASLDMYNNSYIEFGNSTTDPRLTNGVYKDFSISMWVKSYNQATSSNANCYIGKHTRYRRESISFRILERGIENSDKESGCNSYDSSRAHFMDSLFDLRL
jgi:hypothetical protein